MKNMQRTNLYRGTGYEYYVISQFLIKEYEAYKLPVDFGFDLAVCKPPDSNEYDHDRENDIYYFQIKSATLKPFKEKNSYAGNRFNKKASFKINKHQIEKIKDSNHAFLVCCLVEKENDKEFLQGMFCFGKTQIDSLVKKNFLKEGVKEYALDVVFSPKAKLTDLYQENMGILKSELSESKDGLKALKKLNDLIEKSDIVNLKSQNNIYILKNETWYFLDHYFYGVDNFKNINDKNNFSNILSKSVSSKKSVLLSKKVK